MLLVWKGHQYYEHATIYPNVTGLVLRLKFNALMCGFMTRKRRNFILLSCFQKWQLEVHTASQARSKAVLSLEMWLFEANLTKNDQNILSDN